MATASFQDVVLAARQGSIVEVDVLGSSYGLGGPGPQGEPHGTFGFLVASIFVFLSGIIILRKTWGRVGLTELEKPLVPTSILTSTLT